MADKIYRYWIAVPSGLEAVALDELREYAPEVQQVEVEPGGRMGQIFFTYKRRPGAAATATLGRAVRRFNQPDARRYSGSPRA